MDKLRWKVNHSNDFGEEFDFLDTLLIDNGIEKEDIPGFLHPTSKYLNDPFLFKNMREGIELLHKHAKLGSRVLIKADSDADGYTSAATLIQFLDEAYPTFTTNFILNYEKQHGLTYKDISDYEKDYYNLIIIPDASMTVKDAKMIKNNFDVDILVLDHHLIEVEADGDCYTNYCVAINCTDGQYPNPTLTGAGVVQKFIEGYLDTYGEEDNLNPELRTKFLDLVAVGMIGDTANLKNLESRYYVMEGLKESNYNNLLLNEIQERLGSNNLPFGRYISSVGWKIAPILNAVVRYGKEEEQLDFFNAILGVEDDREYTPRRKHKEDPKPPTEIHSLQKTMARIASNIKERQDKDVREFIKELEDEINTKELYKDSVLFVDGTKVLSKGTVTGLVAGRLTGKYFRPVVLMRTKNANEYGGSGRNYSQGSIENLNEFLTKAGARCMGHAGAFGFNCKKEDLPQIIKNCNEMMPLKDMCTIYQCDWEIPASQLKQEYVQDVANNYAIFGNGVPEPTFAITNLIIPADQIQAYGEYGSFIRFTYNGIPFIKQFCPKSDYENMTQRDRFVLGVNKKIVKLNIIGKFELSVYDDKLIPQVKIVDFDSEEVGKTSNVSTTKSEEEFIW